MSEKDKDKDQAQAKRKNSGDRPEVARRSTGETSRNSSESRPSQAGIKGVVHEMRRNLTEKRYARSASGDRAHNQEALIECPEGEETHTEVAPSINRPCLGCAGVRRRGHRPGDQAGIATDI